MTLPPDARVPGSFRDRAGFVFRHQGEIRRAVTARGAPLYDALMDSGLYDHLTAKGMLVRHEEIDVPSDGADLHRVLRPEPIPFISYPYEWCFGQLKAAALLTLDLQAAALDHGMSLRDASAYNIQFVGARPVLIDTLSFGPYEDGRPWIAYRQFCEHFLAPLALMALVDVRLGRLLRVDLEGVPLDLAGRLLPLSSRLRFGLATHVHLHALSQRRYADAGRASGAAAKTGTMSKLGLQGLVDSLRRTVSKLTWRPGGTTWGDYYSDTNYDAASADAKAQLVDDLLGQVEPVPTEVWDLGANTGRYSRIALERGARVLAFDVDVAAVEQAWRQVVDEGQERLLPLVQDLTNPSAGLGWAGTEREPLGARGQPDVVLALALIHHLAIGHNVPLDRIAELFADLAPWLIIELVPKSDSQVQRMLATREDIFDRYDRQGFLHAFSDRFAVVSAVPIPGTERELFLLRRRDDGRS